MNDNPFFAGNDFAGDGGELFASGEYQGLYQPGIIPICWPDKLNPRNDFDPVELNKMLWNSGLPAIWQLWSPCPCGNEQAANTDCPQCHGTGKYYHSSQEVVVGVTQVRRDWKNFDRPNPMEPGTANFLIRGEHVPSLGDRIILLNAHIPMSLAAVRRAALSEEGEPALESLKYPVYPQAIKIRTEDNVQSYHNYGVLFLQGQSRSGLLPGQRLVEGTDFDVTEDGQIDWQKGDELESTPLPGSLFSIYYRTRPVYQVQEFPVAFRDTMTQEKRETPTVEVLPVEFTGRLEWLLETSG